MLRDIIDQAERRTIALDDGARELFEPYADSAPMRAVGLASKLGDQPELRTIAGAMLVAGIAVDSDRLVRAGARMLIAHEAATFVKDRLKTEIDRPRPRSAAGKAAKPRKGKHTAKEMTSFPSGHSAGAIAAARAFSREYPEYSSFALGTAGLIAALQVPRCAHYPSDVAAGLAIGLAVESATNALWNAARMDDRSRGD